MSAERLPAQTPEPVRTAAVQTTNVSGDELITTATPNHFTVHPSTANTVRACMLEHIEYLPLGAGVLEYDFPNHLDGACSDNESEVARRIDDKDRSEASDDFNYVTEPRSVVGKEYAVELEEPPIPSEYCEHDVKLEHGPSGTDEPPADQKGAADGAPHREDRVIGSLYD